MSTNEAGEEPVICGCGATVTGEQCPECGAQVVRLGVATTVTAAPAIGIRKHTPWGGDELQLVGIVYATVVGVCAVVIPLHTWWSRLIFGVVSLSGLVVMGIWKERVIALARRYLSWRGPGQRLQ